MTAARPTTVRARAARLWSRWWLVLGLLAAWQAAGALGLLDRRIAPAPSSVAAAWWTMARSGELGTDVAASLRRVAVGYLAAVVLGLAVGAAALVRSPLRRPVRTLVELLRPIPPIAWVPLAILWVGVGDRAAYLIVAIGAFFPIALTVSDALGGVDPRHVDLARGFGASRRMIVTDVVVPASVPAIMSGLRVGLGLAWTSVIAAELVGAQSGLGYQIQQSRLLLQLERVIAGMATIGVLGLALTRGLYALERRLDRRMGRPVGALTAGMP